MHSIVVQTLKGLLYLAEYLVELLHDIEFLHIEFLKPISNAMDIVLDAECMNIRRYPTGDATHQDR